MQRAPTCENCQRNYELRDSRPTGNRIPLLLPCGHTFCEGCILKATKNKTEVCCFSCEVTVQLEVKGEAGVRTLMPNIYLLGLLLYNRRVASDRITGGAVSTFNGIGNIIYKSNSSLSASSQSTDASETGNDSEKSILCDECNLAKATCQCTNCDNGMFCEECFKKVHSASKLLMKHTALPVVYSSKDQLLCGIHNGRKLEFYDKDVAEAVCAICIISERCRGHDVILLSEFTNESEDEVIDAVEKAKDVLFWWDYSSKALTKELPGEYMEANQLFSDIQANFNACHTLLQKRHVELMQEAAEKLVAGGSIQERLQDLSSKTKSLKSFVKDVEMVMKDKSVLQLKSEEYLCKLNEYIEEPCIVRRSAAPDEDCIKLNIQDKTVDTMEKMGRIEDRTKERFTFQKAADVPDELKEELKTGLVIANEGDEEVKEVIEMNEIILEKDLNSKLRKFSLLSGYNELVCVTDITNPTEFKVQRLSDKDRLQVLMTDLNKYCRYANASENLIYSVEEGQLLCAQFLSDNNWYRARVTNKWCKEYPNVVPSWSNGLSIEVLYIDYGNKEWLPLTRLRQIPKQFLQIPEMAVACMLTDIVPPCKSEEWPERSKKAFASLTGDRPMLMNIRKRVGCKLYVDLRKPEDDEPTRDDDRPVSVRDALVFLEVASFMSPASFPNSDLHEPVRKYKPHEPLIEGEFVDVIVTHIEDPATIYIQKLNSQIADEQSRLGLVYNSKNKKGWMVDYPYRNFVCASKFSADHSWYRARVLNVNHDDTVEVEYVDYGNWETVPFKDLRRIPDMYIEMNQQCIRVKLHGMELAEGEETWSKESKEFLHKFFLGKSLVAVVKNIHDDLPAAEFYDTSTDADINMNELIHKFLTKCDQPDIGVPQLSSNETNPAAPTQDEKVTFATYLPPVIPSVTRFCATVVHVDENANIYIHVMDSDNSFLTDIMQHLNVTINTKKFEKCLTSTDVLHTGEAVIAKFSQDNWWYRVEVVRIVDKVNVEVRYIDFGNIEVANVSSIYPEPMFNEIAGQCICVQLADIKPRGEQWSQQVISLLREYVVSEEVGVELKAGGTSETLQKAIIYMEDGSSINDILIKEELVDALDTIDLSSDTEVVTASKSKSPLQEDQEATSTPPPHQSSYLWFSEQKLPKVGVKLDVVVTQVNQPDVIYIQRLPHTNSGSPHGDMETDETLQEAYDNIMLLENMSEIINEDGYFNDEGLNVKPIVGMSCIGKYTSDGLYYRAKMEHLNEEEGVADVIYVDYGTSEVLPIESLITLPPTLISLPMQATKVCVAGIKPVPHDKAAEGKEMLKDTNWTIEAVKHFYSLVANKRLVAEVLDNECEIPKIQLYECLENEGEIVYICIGEKMNESNFAMFEVD